METKVASLPGPIEDNDGEQFEKHLRRLFRDQAVEGLQQIAHCMESGMNPVRAMRLAHTFTALMREHLAEVSAGDAFSGRQSRTYRSCEDEALGNLVPGPRLRRKGDAVRQLQGLFKDALDHQAEGKREQKIASMTSALRDAKELGDADLVGQLRAELDRLLAGPAEEQPEGQKEGK